MRYLTLFGLALVVCAGAAQAQTSSCSAGFYDPAGGSSCIPAPLGYYVAGAGATAPTPVSTGYYTLTTASKAQVGGAMVTGGLNMTVAGTREVLRGLEVNSTEGLLATVLSGSAQVSQPALSGTSSMPWSSQGVMLQGQSTQAGGFLAVMDQKLGPIGPGSGSGQLWMVGATYRQIHDVMSWRTTVFTGQSQTNLRRSVSEANTPEQHTAIAKISVSGLEGAARLPVPNFGVDWLLQVGVTQFNQDEFSEEARGTPAFYGLKVGATSWQSLPWFTGLTHQWDKVEIQWGLTGDLSGARNLEASSRIFPLPSFDVPVGQPAARAWLVQLKLKPWDVGGGMTLQGRLALEGGPDSRASQMQVALNKSW